jgi:predicted nucleic acid-binding protein
LADQRIIDCCSLLNLYAGWGGLRELAVFGDHWHVGEAVLGEAQYVWQFGPEGARSQVPIDLQPLVDEGLLNWVKPESEAEFESYVEFASDLDDGEAEAMAIAKHRGFILLTDERKALQIAQRADVGVTTATTAQILRSWVADSGANAARLAEVLRNIEERARFRPRQRTPDGEWWEQNR